MLTYMAGYMKSERKSAQCVVAVPSVSEGVVGAQECLSPLNGWPCGEESINWIQSLLRLFSGLAQVDPGGHGP